MEAYLVPLLAALAAALLTAAVLGAVRLGQWWTVVRGGGATLTPVPGPGLAGDASDPRFPRLAHRALGAALLAGVAAILFFAVPESAGACGIELPAAAALLAAWAVTWGPR